MAAIVFDASGAAWEDWKAQVRGVGPAGVYLDLPDCPAIVKLVTGQNPPRVFRAPMTKRNCSPEWGPSGPVPPVGSPRRADRRRSAAAATSAGDQPVVGGVVRGDEPRHTGADGSGQQRPLRIQDDRADSADRRDQSVDIRYRRGERGGVGVGGWSDLDAVVRPVHLVRGGTPGTGQDPDPGVMPEKFTHDALADVARLCLPREWVWSWEEASISVGAVGATPGGALRCGHWLFQRRSDCGVQDSTSPAPRATRASSRRNANCSGPVAVRTGHRAGRVWIGSPLTVERMRFSRRVSPAAAAVGWLVHGSRVTAAEQHQGLTAEYAVEQWCSDTGYPLHRVGVELVNAAGVLASVSRGDTRLMAGLMTAAAPPLVPAQLTGPVIEDLPGAVVTHRRPAVVGRRRTCCNPRSGIRPNSSRRLRPRRRRPTRRQRSQRRPRCAGGEVRHYRAVRTPAEVGLRSIAATGAGSLQYCSRTPPAAS